MAYWKINKKDDVTTEFTIEKLINFESYGNFLVESFDFVANKNLVVKGYNSGTFDASKSISNALLVYNLDSNLKLATSIAGISLDSPTSLKDDPKNTENLDTDVQIFLLPSQD